MSEIQENEQTKGTEKNGAGHIFDVVFWFALRKENSDD
jgi:hypothetical protein